MTTRSRRWLSRTAPRLVFQGLFGPATPLVRGHWPNACVPAVSASMAQPRIPRHPLAASVPPGSGASGVGMGWIPTRPLRRSTDEQPLLAHCAVGDGGGHYTEGGSTIDGSRVALWRDDLCGRLRQWHRAPTHAGAGSVGIAAGDIHYAPPSGSCR